jgi:large subunit ribosomal protein L14
MFQNESRLLVADNYGAEELLIIRCLGGSNRRYSRIGDIVVATVKKVKPNMGIDKGEVVLAIVVTSKKGFRRDNGSFIRFSENYAVLLKEEDRRQPRGTLISVPILREFENWGYKKLLSLTREVI